MNLFIFILLITAMMLLINSTETLFMKGPSYNNYMVEKPPVGILPEAAFVRKHYLGIRNPMNLLYIRIPKTGSEALGKHFRSMSQFVVGYPPTRWPVSNCSTLPVYKYQERLTKYFKVKQNKGAHSLEIAHNQFVNFTTFGVVFPGLVSMIRDPLHQWVSRYYYMRRVEWEIECIDPNLRNTSLDECVRLNHSDRMDKHRRGNLWNTLTYFCGGTELCQTNSHTSLSMAQQNVAQYFGPVGLTSRMAELVKLTKHTYPQFFHYRDEAGQINATVNVKSTNVGSYDWPSNHTVERLMTILTVDYEFYKWIKQRFENNYRAMKLVERVERDRAKYTL